MPPSSPDIALAATAVAWPLVAGLGVVFWSKARSARRARQRAAVDAEVKSLYRQVEGRPVPERLALVVEALEEAEALRHTPVGVRGDRKTPLPIA